MTRNNQATAAVIATSLVLILACLVALGLRFWAMKRIGRSMKIHDYLCIVSFIFCVAYCIDICIGTAYGNIGTHISDVEMEQLTISLKAFFASQFFWAVSITAFRLSILFVYIEIFSVGTFFYYAYALVAIVSLFFIGSITTTLRLCQPINFSWNKTISGVCGDIGTAELAAAALNLSLDIIIVLLPLPLVWGLNMDKQRKIGLTVTFALGLLISAINLGRIIQLKHCDVEDFTYCTYTAILLTIPEMAVGVIVACVPLLGPLIYPNRYKHSGTSRYANLLDNSKKQQSATSSTKTTLTNQKYPNQALDKSPTNSIELSGLPGMNHSHKAWAHSETTPWNTVDTAATGNKIEVEREFRVTT